MKVLVSDKLSEAGVEILKRAPGLSVDVKTGLAPEELKEIIGNTMAWLSAVLPRLLPRSSKQLRGSRS